MGVHPAKLMLAVWGLCVLAFVVLPYQVVGARLSIPAFGVFALFLAAFVAGSLQVPAPRRPPGLGALRPVSARQAEQVLAAASAIAIACILLDLRDKSIFDLTVAYELRSQSADALLYSEASSSSIWFQLAFLVYPAGFVYTVVHLIYAERLRLLKLVLFGLMPVGLATLAMGGRVPIFFCMIAAALAYRERMRRAAVAGAAVATVSRRTRIAMLVGGVLIFAVMFYYFAAVFFVRAQVVGGASEMFDIAEDRWGIAFRGLLSEPLFALLGPEGTYLVFVFIWYLIQGLVMANQIFASYDGPSQLGIYGFDLVSALMRRVDPERVAAGFQSLLDLGTYGFLPSAFGSLYVDFWYFGILICLAWGWAVTVAYWRIVHDRDQRWLVWGPFITMGIVFSLINTPLGFTNGLVTHFWLLLAFLLLKRGRPVEREVPKVAPTVVGGASQTPAGAA